MKWNVHSFSDINKEKAPYVVEAFDEGKRWTCTCPHWIHRLKKSGTRCKHIEFVIENMKRNEEIQAQIAADFENGLLDFGDDYVKPDLYEDDDDGNGKKADCAS